MRTTPLSFVVGTEYLLNGVPVKVDRIDVDTGKVWLERAFTRGSLSFGLQELTQMRWRGELTLPGEEQRQHEPTGRATLYPLTKDQRTRAARRLAYATACAPLYPVGPLSGRLAKAIAEVATRIRDKSPPSPHSVYRWVRRYILSNYDTAVFVQDAGAIRQRKPRIDPKVRERLAVEIERLLGANKGATLSGVMDEALASVAKQLGYLTFTAKDGVEYMPDEFLALAEQRRAQANQEQPRHAA